MIKTFIFQNTTGGEGEKYELSVTNFSIQNMDMVTMAPIYANDNVDISTMSVGIMIDSSETEAEIVYPVTGSAAPAGQIDFGNTEILMNALNYTPKVDNYTIYGFACRFQNVLYNGQIGTAYSNLLTMGGTVIVRGGYGSLTNSTQVDIKDTNIGLSVDGSLYFKITGVSIPVTGDLIVQLDTPTILISEIS